MESRFVRNIDPMIFENLKATPLFNLLLPDIKNGTVFPAFRNNRVDFYHRGRNLFSYSRNGFITNIKYASVLVGNKPYIREKELSHALNIQSFADGYQEIKKNCERYSGPEGQGVSQICSGFKSLFGNNPGLIIPLDIEISLTTEDDEPMDEDFEKEKRRDRIDLLLFNTDTKTFRLYEAKHYLNHELWPRASKEPAVIDQMERYGRRICAQKANILKQYQNYVGLLTQLFDGHLKMTIPAPTEIDNIPLALLAFGYDQPQESRVKKLLKTNMKDTPCYSCGTPSPDRLKNIWYAKSIK